MRDQRLYYPIKEQTIPELLRERAATFGDKPAFIYKDRVATFSGFAERTAVIAANLQRLGIEKGDRVGVMLTNSIEIVEAFFGIWYRGAVAVSVSPMSTPREVAYVVNDSRAKMVICLNSFYETVHVARQEMPGLEKVVVVGPDRPEGSLSWDELLENAEPCKEEVGPDDLAMMLYTSGTEGKPKGAMLSHVNFMLNAKQIQELYQFGPDDVNLTMLPLFHLFAIAVNTRQAYYAGNTNVIIDRFDPRDVFEAIEKHRVTWLVGVPTMYIYMLNYPEAARYDTSSLRLGMVGGGNVNPDLKTIFEERFQMILLEVYGQTETSPGVMMEGPFGGRRPGSMGRVLGGWEVRLVDENDNDVPVGEPGEIVVRGPCVMQGYFEMPGANEEAFRNGWHHTGDIARRDADGFYYFVDRRKEMLITGGYNIYPKEIEDVLYTHPDILEAAVIGVPDAAKGEVAKALIVKKPGAELTADQVMAFCREKLAAYKRPRSIEFIDQLPKTPQGKITKVPLREMAGSGNCQVVPLNTA